ncbi:MAG: hypothetical protein MH321_02925 [Leptospiraceae bacterium]|nr:hypothetical protein [Leptospiraceae bacterium]
MSLKTSNDWNQFLVRFLLAFGFWEVVAFPLRMLFFSKFYFDPSLSSIFVPMANIYWIGPIAADFVTIFALGALYFLCKGGLPEGLVGGLLFGILFSISAYLGPVLILSTFLKIGSLPIWWVWVVFQSLQAITVSAIYSLLVRE